MLNISTITPDANSERDQRVHHLNNATYLPKGTFPTPQTFSAVIFAISTFLFLNFSTLLSGTFTRQPSAQCYAPQTKRTQQHFGVSQIEFPTCVRKQICWHNKRELLVCCMAAWEVFELLRYVMERHESSRQHILSPSPRWYGIINILLLQQKMPTWP